METQQLSRSPNTTTRRSTVDTSRPFRSVKEAVAILGERLLAGDLHHSPKPFYRERDTSPPGTPRRAIADDGDAEDSGNGGEEKAPGLIGAVKKLEAELEETKAEPRLLKERESETEVALASLNAELHMSMSKIAEAEAAGAAAKAVALRSGEGRSPSSTLAQILSTSERAGGRNSKTNRRGLIKTMTTKKKKPIIPLVSDLFFRKRAQSTTKLHSHPYASSKLYL